MKSQLTRIRVAGFRSLRDVKLELTPLTLLIGPNGSGKSNLITVLRMVPLMRTQSLRNFVGSDQGGASAMLHYGPSATREIELDLMFTVDNGQDSYSARLGYAAGDTFVFLDEAVSFHATGKPRPLSVSLGAGHAESLLNDRAKDPNAPAVRMVNGLLSRISFFHFHDTSLTSPLRQNAMQSDNKYVRSNGSNLAAYLHRIKHSTNKDDRAAWTLLEGLVRRIAPFIASLEPDLVAPDRGHTSAIRLYWTDERGYRFDPHALSDGTLRAIALFAALTQPPDARPHFFTIDEPELGLHPAAISILAGLLRSVSAHSQILVASQSPALLDEFAPDEVIVAERRDSESHFARLDPKELETWLEDYSLSQLYDKNVLGGRP